MKSIINKFRKTEAFGTLLAIASAMPYYHKFY